MDSEVEETTVYIVKHANSASKTQIRCGLDKDKKPKLLSVQMLSGKVIPLHGIRQAFKKLQEKHEKSNVPDQPA